MHCTGCQYLDGRFGECRELNIHVVCRSCGELFAIAQARCPTCDKHSPDVAGILQRDTNGEYITDRRCRLTEAQRASLVAAQNAPEPLKQGSLF